MIVKALKDIVIDGKLRVKGEVFKSASTENCVVVVSKAQEKQNELKAKNKVKKVKVKKRDKTK